MILKFGFISSKSSDSWAFNMTPVAQNEVSIGDVQNLHKIATGIYTAKTYDLPATLQDGSKES